MDDTIRDSVSKLPILGDIPILGNAFSYSTKQKEKRNLLIFIHPTILNDQAIADDISAQKYKYIRAQQLLEGMKDDNTPINQISERNQDSNLPPWMTYE